MRATASLSVDLDNTWSYLKIHGDPGWSDFPSCLDLVAPHILEAASTRDMRMTMFVVGQDAALSKNAEALSLLGASGHEVGNHSFNHEPWLHLKNRAEIDYEIKQAHDSIAVATGSVPVGFRGPGFSISRAALETLSSQGYLYDASTLPTFIGPIARAYYFKTARIEPSELDKRERLFGKFTEVFRPIRPYRWSLGEERSQILEIPVTTMPLSRLPIHATYLLYLAGFSERVARAYLRTALSFCRLTRVEPSFLLHSLDFLGRDDVTDLEFFPGMNMPGEQKRRLVGEFLDMLGEDHEIVTMREHADRLVSNGVSRRQAALLP